MSEEAEAAVRGVIARWHAATAAGDVEALRPLMTADAVFLVAGGSPIEGREAFLDSLRGALARVRIASSFTVREIRSDGTLATAWSDLVVRIEPREGGAASERRGSALSVFRRGADGAWMLCRDANLLGPPSPCA